MDSERAAAEAEARAARLEGASAEADRRARDAAEARAAELVAVAARLRAELQHDRVRHRREAAAADARWRGRLRALVERCEGRARAASQEARAELDGAAARFEQERLMLRGHVECLAEQLGQLRREGDERAARQQGAVREREEALRELRASAARVIPPDHKPAPPPPPPPRGARSAGLCPARISRKQACCVCVCVYVYVCLFVWVCAYVYMFVWVRVWVWLVVLVLVLVLVGGGLGRRWGGRAGGRQEKAALLERLEALEKQVRARRPAPCRATAAAGCPCVLSRVAVIQAMQPGRAGPGRAGGWVGGWVPG